MALTLAAMIKILSDLAAKEKATRQNTAIIVQVQYLKPTWSVFTGYRQSKKPCSLWHLDRILDQTSLLSNEDVRDAPLHASYLSYLLTSRRTVLSAL